MKASEDTKKNSLLYNIQRLVISDSFVFTLYISFCFVVHVAIAVFSLANNVMPLFLFNIVSILIYLFLTLLTKTNKELTIYIGYVEIAVHALTSVQLIGDYFGFTMYFLAIVPICYCLLHACNSKFYLIKGTILALSSFIMYVICYFVSAVSKPVYTSARLDHAKSYAFIINMFLTFVAASVFSILFLVETAMAYNQLSDRNKQLNVLANHDPLTGLFNRRTMKNHVETLFYQSKNEAKPFALILCDIDDFKKINDTYGHDCGDEVLKSIATTLTNLTRGGDFLCRWGGEEFLILLNGQSLDTTRIAAERIRSRINDLAIEYNGREHHITMTFGIAASSEADQYETLFRLADERLYYGKKHGKNCVN